MKYEMVKLNWFLLSISYNISTHQLVLYNMAAAVLRGWKHVRQLYRRFSFATFISISVLHCLLLVLSAAHVVQIEWEEYFDILMQGRV